MTVYLPRRCRTYRFDFEHRGRRYTGSTGMSRLQDAREFERKERVRLERQAGDLSRRAEETPRIQDFAEVFYEHKRTRARLKRPELLEREIRVVLEFCGARPTTPAPAPRKGAPPRRAVPVAPPYHDLRLGDFIERPELITDFERWLTARGTGGSARNHYRSVMSGLYKVALLPEYRRATGVSMNPFAGLERDRPVRRRVTQSVDELRAWVAHAAPHVQLALAIGALAPALRLGNILALRWDVHVDETLHFITVTDYKTDSTQLEPLVVPIVAQLRSILVAARASWQTDCAKRIRAGKPTTDYVVQFRGRRLGAIKKGLRAAAARAHVPYGIRTAGGATFHTLRHTMSTMLAQLGVSESHRKELLNHSDIATTQLYTHLRPMHLVAALEQLSDAVTLDLASGKVAGPAGETPKLTEGKRSTTVTRAEEVATAKHPRKAAAKTPGRRAS